MDPEKKATEANAAAIAPQEPETASPEQDAEAKMAALEAEKAKILEERDNYKAAYLKEARKGKPDADDLEDEDQDEKITRKVNAALANSRLAEIARQQDELLKQALKENKELKAAHLNKQNTAPPASMGASSDMIAVRSTSITPEQMAYFKSRNWTDKDIERYKKNLQKRI